MKNLEIVTWRMPNTPIEFFEKLHTYFTNCQCGSWMKIITCQRIILASTTQSSAGLSEVLDSLPDDDLARALKYGEQYRATEAFVHMVNVTAGLDSYVIGETQISHQIKCAYKLYKKTGQLLPDLDRTFQEIFKLSKKIHHSTGIPHGKISVLSLLEDEIRTMIHNHDDAKVAIVGTGEMGTKTVTLLRRIDQNINITWFTSREDLLDSGKYLSSPVFHKRDLDVENFDAVFLATYYPLELENHHEVSLVVDLAIPRGVTAAENSKTKVVTLEDLRYLSDRNLAKRKELKRRSKKLISNHLSILQRKEILNEYRDKILELRKKLLEAGERKKTFLLEHNNLENQKKMEKLIDSAINEVVHVAQKEIEDLIVEEIK